MTCIVAENTLDAIFMNLRHFYAPSAKKGQKIEVKGYHFQLKELVIKFGSIAMGSTNRGIVVEVIKSFMLLPLIPTPCHHLPLSPPQTEDGTTDVVGNCWESLTEFVKGLLGYSSAIVPPHFSTVSNRPYRASDRMIHYAHIFTQLRKPPGAASTPMATK